MVHLVLQEMVLLNMIKVFINPYRETKIKVLKRVIKSGEPEMIAIDYNGHCYLLELGKHPLLKTFLLDKDGEPFVEIDRYRTKI